MTLATPASKNVLSIVARAAQFWRPTWNTPESRAILVAISGQEAGFTAVAQVLSGGGKGPARGLWQFERAGGVRGVLTHRVSKPHIERICATLGYKVDERTLWQALERDDVLACCFARLLLLTDPNPLPPAIQASYSRAWSIYNSNWRPGKPHPNRWPNNWAIALATIAG